jgi:Holliday junction DNA helicase RuvA
MIDRLRGTVVEREPDLLLSIGPLTLRLEVSEQTRRALPERGAAAEIFAELIVREDSLGLVGFSSPEERRLFGILLGIAGVGKRLALAILSELSVTELAQVVSLGDEKRLTAVAGVGAKTASRLLLELGSKLDEFLPVVAAPLAAADFAEDPRREEALLALVTLGLSRQAALKSLAEFGDGDLGVEEMIRRALGAAG